MCTGDDGHDALRCPALSPGDLETIRRWIACPSQPAPFTVGDTHIRTVTGVNYDFQAVGEFVLLRDEFLEIQAGQTGVRTDRSLGPDESTGLTSCVSVNTAMAIRIGTDRTTYQPKLKSDQGQSDMELRINGPLKRTLFYLRLRTELPKLMKWMRELEHSI